MPSPNPMKESSKTSIFLAVALFLTLIAYFMQPKPYNDSPDVMVGKFLFADKFTDPLEIRSLEIAKIDPTGGDLNRFQIASDKDGSWTIPSHENYPADARDQMGQVASALIGLQILSVAPSDVSASDAKGDGGSTNIHALYGVVDPTAEGASASGGAGIKVVCLGEAEKELAQLIIGKEVEGKPELRYVRVPNQHPVYTAKISTSAMSTRFEDWIEKNLLKIDSFDIHRVNIEDYAVDFDRGTRDFSSSIVLNHNDQAPAGQRWTLESMKLLKDRVPTPTPLADNEELAEDTLSTMVNAVDDLKIVDVRRKPTFLANPLRESKPLDEKTVDKDPKIAAALAQRGFYFAVEESPDGKEEVALFSSNGEIHIAMKNGMKYLLRFGSPAGMGTENAESEDGKEPESSVSLNRYLFIMTEFDESQIEKPALEPLPEVPTEGEEAAIAEAKKKLEDVEKSNARLQDHYNEQVESGKKQSAEMNKRFADWYYIISEDVFKKIHLGKDTLIRPKKQDAKDGEKTSSIDLRTDHEGYDDEPEFPELRELNAPTLPGQEGLFPNPEPVQEPAQEPAKEPEKTEEPKPDTTEPTPAAEQQENR